MEYRKNTLCYEDYCKLRESVGWQNSFKVQTQTALDNSLYIVTAVDQGKVVGMGRLTGDGMYYMIVDVVVHPAHQGQKIGTDIIKMLTEYVQDQTPVDGRSSIFLIAEPGKEGFYEKAGFRKIPHEYCGSGMRKVVYAQNCPQES